LGTCGGVPRSQKVLSGLGRELGEKHGIVRENWGCNRAEMELGRREWEEGEQR